MARSRTLAELETFIRREADMVNSAFVSSDEVRDYINESWAQLYDRVCLFDQEYYLRYVDFSTAGAGSYDLLNAGKTGVGRSVTLFIPSGSGHTVGQILALTQASTGANTAYMKVETIDGSGAVVTASIYLQGNGYISDSLATNSAVVSFPSTPIPGTASLYVESDFYKVKGVWFGNGVIWNPLKRFQWEELNMFAQAGLYAGTSQLPLYRVISENGREKIYLTPDILGGSLRVWYYPAPPIMSNTQDRVDGRAGWDDWVIKDAAIKCLLKEESIEQAASLKVIRDEIWSRIQLHASDRDGSQPERVRNVRLLSRRLGPWS